MLIDIQTQHFALTTALPSHIERRLYFAPGTHHDYVRRKKVRLSDINGPRSDSDKCCQLRIGLQGRATFVIEDTQPDLYVAIDRASDRARRTVKRKLRLNSHKRSHLPDGKYALDVVAPTEFLT